MLNTAKAVFIMGNFKYTLKPHRYENKLHIFSLPAACP